MRELKIMDSKLFYLNCRHWSVFAIAVLTIIVLLWLNISVHTEGQSRSWGWPLRLWGSGVVGDYGDPLDAITPYLNLGIGLAIVLICSLGWTLLLTLLNVGGAKG